MPQPNQRLKHERQLRGWSQGRLAEHIDVPDYYVSRWERGEVQPSPFYQQKLCDLFGKTAEELGFLQSVNETPPPGTLTVDRGAIFPSAEGQASPQSPVPMLTDGLPEQVPFPPPAEPSSVPLPTSSHDHSSSPQQTDSFLSAFPAMPTTPPPVPSSPDAQSPPPPFPSPSTPRTGRKRLLIALFVLLFVLAGSSIGILSVFPGKQTHSASATKTQPVGDVFFLNSEQFNAQNSQGVDDEVEIDLHSIPSPPPGKSYYAWLQSDEGNGEGSSIFLGTLQVNQGSAHLLYMDPHHANLLLYANRFLVTEEDSNPLPLDPSLDVHTWRFSSSPPQTTLIHLRHLLANSPELQLRQLQGGLAIWFLRNTEKVEEWAVSARDDLLNSSVNGSAPDTGAIHNQLIRILDFIDGASYVQTDVPANTPLLVGPYDAQVALVGPAPAMKPAGYLYNGKGEVPPGYVYLIETHMNAAVSLPQATSEQRQLAIQIDTALSQVSSYLEQVRQDARQLVSLRGSQLVTPQAQFLLNDMAAAAQHAYAGPIAPSANQSQGGAVWIYGSIQRLAIFEVQPYTATERSLPGGGS